MNRRLALKLLASGPAWAQRRASAPSAPQTVVDAVVNDRDGNPVRNLPPSDFVVTEDGHPRSISSFAAVDAVSGATRSASNLPLPLKIDPGDVHRTFVLLVDDAGISADAAETLRRVLLKFVGEQIGEHDTVALIRTSGGAGPIEQLTSDRALLREAIGQIMLNPAATLPSVPSWPQVLNYILAGLRTVPGRKALVIFADRIPTTCIFDRTVAAANRAWTSIYLVHSAQIQRPPLCAAEDLTTGTAGLTLVQDASAALARIARDQESYYLLGFESPSATTLRDPVIAVSLSHAALDLRSRRQPPATSPFNPQFAPGSAENELRRVMQNPFDSGSMRIRLSAVFSRPAGYQVDATLLVDGRDVTFTRRLSGTYEAGLDVLVRVYDPDGRVLDDHAMPTSVSAPTAKAYEHARDEGVVFTVRIPVLHPGVLQIYAAVRDSTSSNNGIAHRMIEVPDIAKGDFLISNVALFMADQADTDDPRHVFRPGQQIVYKCAIYNAKADSDKSAQLEVRTLLFAGGQQVYAGQPIDLTVADAANRQWLSLRGKLELASTTSPGEFILQVLVKDKVSGRTASQWTDFTLR